MTPLRFASICAALAAMLVLLSFTSSAAVGARHAVPLRDGGVAVRTTDVASQPAETITVDRRAPARPFPHIWERMFGSGRAILSLRDSYRRDLRQVKDATDFGYVRFHAILDDEVGVYDEDSKGQPIYNFSYVDQIYDGLLDAGVRPFVELSFMPSKLAARGVPHPFWYKPIVSPPRDWNRWGDLVSRLAAHLVDRYGIDEVSQWYFEVWNEPNIDFWAGEPKQATYERLYDVTAAALKKVNARLRVGGPATSAASWIPGFITHAVHGGVPLDFVSTHVYGNDSARQVLGTDDPVPVTEMVARAVRKVHDQVHASPRPELPIIWSEYNASYKNEPEVTDSVFMGPWLASTIRQCDGLADVLAYWTFSDVFEEQGVVRKPFYGGFGLIAEDGIPKPAFNAFKVLHALGDRRLAIGSDSALATVRADGALVVAVWNLSLPGEAGTPKSIRIAVTGVTGDHRATIARVDATHGSPLDAFAAMGSPAWPTRDQIAKLRQASALGPPETATLRPTTGAANQQQLDLVLPSKGRAVVEIR